MSDKKFVEIVNGQYEIESKDYDQHGVWLTLREGKAFGGSVMMPLKDAKEVVKALQEVIDSYESAGV